MRKEFPYWIAATAAAIVFVLCLAASCGCDGQAAGLRFAPGEAQKQNAQAARDIAGVADAAGLPPGSPATARLADATAAAAAYAGEPKTRVDVAPLVAGARDAWATLKAQADAYALKSKLAGKAGAVQARQLSAVASDWRALKAKGKALADELLPRLQAVIELGKMSDELASSIPVPRAELTPEQAENQRMIDAALAQITATAQEAAAARPTLGDVGDNVVKAVADASVKAKGWGATIGGVVEDWSGLIAGITAGGIGIGYGVRHKRKAAKAAAKPKISVPDLTRASTARPDNES